jgi:RNA polymerase sigma-70 factor (ECF subfamily)
MEREGAEEVSIVLSAIFSRLGREERAALLLHEVFEYDYPELARVLGKAEPACRQIVHRARKRVRQATPPAAATTESRERMLAMFLQAVKSGDGGSALSLVEAEV